MTIGCAMVHAQRGGFFVGLTVGLLLGSASRSAVALYVPRSRCRSSTRVPQRTVEEAPGRENRNWDPNARWRARTARLAPVRRCSDKRDHDRHARNPAGAGRGPPAIRRSPAKAGAAARLEPLAFVYFVQAGAFTRADEAERNARNWRRWA